MPILIHPNAGIFALMRMWDQRRKEKNQHILSLHFAEAGDLLFEFTLEIKRAGNPSGKKTVENHRRLYF